MLQARGSIAAILPSIAATRSSNERKNGGNGGEDGSNWETLLLAFLLETLRRLGCVQAAQLSESDCFLCYYSLSCLTIYVHRWNHCVEKTQNRLLAQPQMRNGILSPNAKLKLTLSDID
ncbi:hypothetical protein Y032_0151g2843 [Ancylostoma ceylanicum]|uniref:Uncharacterized protein n=1 Tax=Ancylostoma ceylanicum TaxID=53326 RepID=A0A016T059_9BILA|nr:hypothetical protein Y032_0151g2843 [Ancylostoma ceylanicum]